MLNKGDKSGNFSLAIFALIGLTYLGSAFFFFSYLDYTQADRKMLTTMENVKKQYMEFKQSDTESEAMSLMRLQDEMKQIGQQIALEHKELTMQTLRDYSESMHFSGMMLLDEHGDFVAEYASNSKYFDVLQKEIMRRPLLDVAKMETKFYLRRLFFDDGSYIDISAHQRFDAPGIIICYDHTAADHIDNHNLTLQTLLMDYDTKENPTIVIGDGYKVLASNERRLFGTLTNKNRIIAQLKKEGVKGELVQVIANGKSYYGSLDSGRDFFVYLYGSEDQIYAKRWQRFGGALVVYVLVTAVWYYRLRRKQKKS